MESNVKFENVTTLIQHEHPLHLVDLQPCYPDYVEFSDDEEEDKVIKWDFTSPCNQCGKDINVYHRYYYKCTDSSCDYVLHKSCAKPLPEKLILKSHSLTHSYTLYQGPVRGSICHICSDEVHGNWYYDCLLCEMEWSAFERIHVKCAMKERENHTIYHPSHPHPLQSGTSQPIICKCDACGKEHRGIFYHCTTCFNHNIHIDCAFLPRMLQIQHHTHPLIISYSSEHIERSYMGRNRSYVGSTCRICRAPFGLDYLWNYKCESCRYFVHLDCATSRNEPLMSIKNYKDADHPELLNLPFPDQTYSILQHWLSKESGSTTGEKSVRNLINHISHQHVLSLVSTQSNEGNGATSSSVSSLSCHNPMKRIELLCNGCVRPIMHVPFYKCSSEDQLCDFVLHEGCTRLPSELPNYPGHPQHTLVFVSKIPGNLFGFFDCENCYSICNGFAYGCTECDYYIDVNCGFIPEEITHEAHPDHILSRCYRESMRKPCVAEGLDYGCEISFSCRSCDFYLHSDCALSLPRIINHKLDKHPMKLTYGPVENHKSEYFCEVCEEKLNPNLWFYHCHVCAYSLHTRCAPVIVNFEAAIHGYKSLYKFLNIKFGGSYNIKGHEHSVSLVVGSRADELLSDCRKCCVEDSDEYTSKIIYSGGVLEVCMRKLVFYPEVTGKVQWVTTV
nr:zinc finger, PHD-type [Tanacetum cinerariifolium]GEY82812.1 zinc finger, PHD-type [Tanacetum cinerariifolium]